MTAQVSAPRPASSFKLWYMAVVLCLTNAVAFVDRQSLPLLIDQIKTDLKVSDTEVSFLVGLAFIITYAGFSIPAGMLVDKFPRRAVMSAAITFWSASTVFCSFAGSFTMMLIGRLGIGAGESVGGPGSMSLVRDAFPPEKRGRAVGIWAMGANIGGAAALLLGGAILAAINDAHEATVPVFGAVRSWQLVLFCCAMITLPVALLVWTFPEPPRTGAGESGGFGDAMRFMASRWKLFGLVFLVNAVTIILVVPHGIWVPAMFGRVWQVPRPTIGFTFGLMTLFLGASSQFLAGTIMDRFEKAGIKNPIPLFGVIVTLLLFIPAVWMPLAPSVTMAWILQGVYMLVGTSLFTIGTAFVTRLAPPEIAGKVTSLHFLWMGLIGTFVGTSLYAVVSDRVFAGTGPMAMAYSLAWVAGALDVLACIGFIALLGMTTRLAQQST